MRMGNIVAITALEVDARVHKLFSWVIEWLISGFMLLACGAGATYSSALL